MAPPALFLKFRGLRRHRILFWTGNTIQVGGFASGGLLTFGTAATTRPQTISPATNDLLINGDFEVDASAQFGQFCSNGYYRNN